MVLQANKMQPMTKTKNHETVIKNLHSSFPIATSYLVNPFVSIKRKYKTLGEYNLNERTIRVIIWKLYEKKTYSYIAKKLGVTKERVRQILHKGMCHFENYIKKGIKF